MREDLEALIVPRRVGLAAEPGAAATDRGGLRALEHARLSPLAEWHYRTAWRDSWVSIESVRELLGWEPRLSNAATLCATYEWYLAHRELLADAGVTHRVLWNERALGGLRRLS